MVTSGVLDKLLAAHYEYAFVSNSDNLGAMLDLRILGYMAELEIPFLMEVAFRTQADRKGGHLAQRPRRPVHAPGDRPVSTGRVGRFPGHGHL